MEPYQRLEHDWAAWNGLDPAGMVACASGTAALHLCFEALQLPQGSEVVMGDYNMIACARSAALAGLTPVFVDCDERLLMDIRLRMDTDKVKAVMPVHIYGRRLDMELLYKQYKGRFRIVEDLAEAHGVRPHPQTDAATWSFYRNKIIAGQEGGAVWFRNQAHADLARELRSLGFTAAHDFRHTPRGHNYRMSNAHASLVLASLGAYSDNHRRRRELEAACDALCPDAWRMPPRDAPWVYDLRVPGMDTIKQGKVVTALNEVGIAARYGFWPMHKQEEFKSCRLVKGGESNALRLATEVIYLSLAGIDEGQIKLAFDVIGRIVS